MTYAALVAAIETLVKEAGVASFWTGAKLANGLNYNALFPMCEFFNTQPSQVLASVVRYNIGMGFYGKDAHENATNISNEGASEGETTVDIQSAMDELSLRFIALLREQEAWELVGDSISRVPTIRNGTKIGTGLFIDFTLDVPLTIC